MMNIKDINKYYILNKIKKILKIKKHNPLLRKTKI